VVRVDLLAEARANGLAVWEDNGRLVVRGPRSAEPLAKELLEHKAEVIVLLEEEQALLHTASFQDSQIPARGLGYSPALPASACYETLEVRLETQLKERDRLGARLDKGCEFLTDLACRAGQESAAYERYFTAWLEIKSEYEHTCDEITALAARQELASWHVRQRSARANARRLINPEGRKE
jgi:hypothetical protein